MKKLLALLAVIVLALALSACHRGEAEEEPAIEEEPAVQAAAEKEEAAKTEEEQEAEALPAALVGSWQLDGGSGPAAAELVVAAEGAVSFFMGGGVDGAGQIKMENGQAVAYTKSYMESVEYSFTLTPAEYRGEPAVEMELNGQVYYWVQARPEEQAASVPAPAAVDEGFDRCLDDIAANVQPGTSAAFMHAVEQAAALMDWASTTPMSDEDVATAFAARLLSLDSRGMATLLAQLELVDGAYRQLLEPGQEELLAAAGVENSGYPWSAAATAEIEALMNEAGLR